MPTNTTVIDAIVSGLDTEVDVTILENDDIEADVGSLYLVRDHNILIHRDVPNQHPISAIEGLSDILDSIDLDALTNEEIEELLSN